MSDLFQDLLQQSKVAYIFKLYDADHPDQFFIGVTKSDTNSYLQHFKRSIRLGKHSVALDYFRQHGYDNLRIKVIQIVNYLSFSQLKIALDDVINEYDPPLNPRSNRVTRATVQPVNFDLND